MEFPSGLMTYALMLVYNLRFRSITVTNAIYTSIKASDVFFFTFRVSIKCNTLAV